MTRKVLKSATMFVRDNVAGDLVIKGDMDKRGNYIYKMESGCRYVLSETEMAVIYRLNFKPRFK